MPKRTALIGIAIAATIGIRALISLEGHDDTQAVPEAPETAQALPQATKSSVLTPPVTSAPTAVQPVPANAKSEPKEAKILHRSAAPSLAAQAPSSSQSTTSELPPRLTTQQEAVIPDSDQAIEDRGDEHIPQGTDWDLPSATVPDTGTTQP